MYGKWSFWFYWKWRKFLLQLNFSFSYLTLQRIVCNFTWTMKWKYHGEKIIFFCVDLYIIMTCMLSNKVGSRQMNQVCPIVFLLWIMIKHHHHWSFFSMRMWAFHMSVSWREGPLSPEPGYQTRDLILLLLYITLELAKLFT